MRLGLTKLAQQDQSEVIQPEEKDTGTAIVCNSDCRYSQNPEKLCMLTNIALTMGKQGEFVCAQYSPVMEGEQGQQVMGQNEMGMQGAQPQGMQQPQVAQGAQPAGPRQSQRELGLAGAKTKN